MRNELHERDIVQTPRKIHRATTMMGHRFCLHTLGYLFALGLSVQAQQWEPLPLITADTLRAGGTGGEGTQYCISLACDPHRGDLLFLGTDVGGIFRSLDGGKSWAHTNLGLSARGACSFAVDPNNQKRVLLVGCNSMQRDCHGIYLSEDEGVTWRGVQPYSNLGYRDFREQLAFDPSTYDLGKNRTMVAYWSTEANDQGRKFFKSLDGGDTWQKMPDDHAGASILKVHPKKGFVYAANDTGFWRSTDGGQTFSQVTTTAIRGMDIVDSAPDNIYILTEDGLSISHDAGESFQRVESHQFPPKIAHPGGAPSWWNPHFSTRLKVSPADPNRMLLDNDEGAYNWHRYVTGDGGVTWQPVKLERGESFTPMPNREAMFVWSPIDPETAWSYGGDFITVSHDGGKTFTWSNGGYNGVMVGGAFHFSAQDPDTMYFGSQDYDGAVTGDAGKTWTYIGLDGQGWGGEVYGGYAANAKLMYGGQESLDSPVPKHLRITRDGGAHVTDTGIKLRGLATSMGDPDLPNVLFCFEYRSEDSGETWKKMEDCSGVLTDGGNRLWGGNGHALVTSTDHGATWTKAFEVPGDDVNDIAYDPEQKQAYVSAGGKLFLWHEADAKLEEITQLLPADQFGNRGAYSVAVDPGNPRVVYTAKSGNIYLMDTAVARSVDGGKSWQNLIVNLRHNSAITDGPQGALEANWVRVHPRNHYAYFGTNCFGFWRIAPPQ